MKVLVSTDAYVAEVDLLDASVEKRLEGDFGPITWDEDRIYVAQGNRVRCYKGRGFDHGVFDKKCTDASIVSMTWHDGTLLASAGDHLMTRDKHWKRQKITGQSAFMGVWHDNGGSCYVATDQGVNTAIFFARTDDVFDELAGRRVDEFCYVSDDMVLVGLDHEGAKMHVGDKSAISLDADRCRGLAHYGRRTAIGVVRDGAVFIAYRTSRTGIEYVPLPGATDVRCVRGIDGIDHAHHGFAGPSYPL